MVPGHEINLVIQHCHSLYSDPHLHSPVYVCQSGWVIFPLSAIMLNFITSYQSEQSACYHIEGAWSDHVVVPYIHVLCCCHNHALCSGGDMPVERGWCVRGGMSVGLWHFPGGVTHQWRVVHQWGVHISGGSVSVGVALSRGWHILWGWYISFCFSIFPS